MSLIGQAGPAMVSDVLSTVQAQEWSDHDHEWHELLWGTRGALTAETGDGNCAVAARQGLWIPARVVHRVTAATSTTLLLQLPATGLGPISPARRSPTSHRCGTAQ